VEDIFGNIFGNIKRIKIFEKLLIGKYKSGFFFKDLENNDEHSTLGIYKGIIDVHKTKEGSEKKYESIDKYDIGKTLRKIVSDPESFLKGFTEFADNMKEVTFEEKEYAEYKITSFKTQEEFLSLLQRKNKDVIIPIESAKEFFPFKNTIPWNESKGKIKDGALVLNKDGIPIGFLLKIQEKILFQSISVMENPFVSRLISMMTNPEKFEPEEKHDSQGKN
jgi:hypothetical protein